MRTLLRVLMLATGLLVAGAHPTVATAQTSSGVVADLKSQLEKGLKARRPQDFVFIKKVVEKVANDELSVELVKSTFQWARENGRYKNYPYPHFEQALRLRAKKLGITL